MRPLPVLLLLTVCNVSIGFADEAPAARAMHDRLLAAVDAIDADLPAITQAAERAADAFVAGEDIALRNAELLRQLNSQPGGLMANFGSVGDNGYTPKTYADGALAPITRAVASWTWTCELFAAATRRGKTPVVRIHRDLDGKRRWYRTHRSTRFHDDIALPPIDAGVLGKQYLGALRDVLRDVGTASWRSIARTANRASDVIISGRGVFVRSPRRLPDPMHLFIRLDHAGEEPGLPVPGQGDFTIAIGSDEAPGSFDWGEAHLFRRASRGVAWVVGAYQRRPRELWRREFVVDQQWPYGQALVKVDSYRPRLGNATGIIADAILLMITEQTGTIVAAHRAADRRPPRPPIELQRVPQPAPKKPAPDEEKPPTYILTRR